MKWLINSKLICHWPRPITGVTPGCSDLWNPDERNRPYDIDGLECVVITKDTWTYTYFPTLNITYRWSENEIDTYFALKINYFKLFEEALNEAP